ncbi:MAG: hypothetical protein HWN66_12645 [Candidatus Helarchaeota archaeon]|nr:hypothetical protein [Candidatus Helarchaeota archaeon]
MSQFEFILAREAQLMYRRAREFEPISGNLSRWRGSIPGRGHYKDIKFEVEISIPADFPRQAPVVTLITPTNHPQVDPTTGNLTLRILSYWRSEYHLYQVVNSIKGLFARVPPKLPDTFSSTLTTSVSKDEPPQKPDYPPPFQPPSSPKSIPSHPTSRKKPQKAPRPASEMPEESPKVKELKSQVSKLESELSSLQTNLVNKTEEIARLEGQMDVHNVPRTGPDRIDQILHPKNGKDTQLLDLQSEKIALEDLILTLENKFEIGEINSSEYAKLYKSYQKQLHLINKKLNELGINQ